MILENNSYPNDTRVRLEANSLAEAGFDVTVICPTGDGRPWHEQIDNVRVYRYPAPISGNGLMSYAWEFSYSLAMAFLLSLFIWIRHGFDVLHVHSPPDMNALIPAFFQLFGKRFVYDMHDLSPELLQAQRGGTASHWLMKLLRGFERFACQRADRLIATNETQRRIQVTRGGADPCNSYVVRNGPSQRLLSDVQPNQSLKSTGKTCIGFVGAIGHQDGVEYLIHALHCLKTKLHCRDFKCIIVGDGVAQKNLMRLVDEFQLNDFVQFTGRIPFEEVPGYIAAFDIGVVPDPSNPYNDSCSTIKAMEYMALGKPLVCFATLENRVTAASASLYANNNDVEQFAECLHRLLIDPALRERMGAAGRERIENGLTWKHQAKVLIDLYRGLLAPDASLVPVPQPDLGVACGSEPALQFAFDGKLGNTLLRAFRQDARGARLSGMFRIYYRLRRWIPTAIRAKLQSIRNQSIANDDDWYLSHNFVSCWTTAVDNEIREQRDPWVIHPWPDDFSHAIVLTHDIETQTGYDRIEQLAKVDEEFGFRSAWFLVPHKYRIESSLIAELQRRGHEVGVHGYNHDGRCFESRKFFGDRLGPINAALANFRAVGFRAPMVQRNLVWMQELNVEYDASCFDHDPYQSMPGGIGSVWPFRCGRFVELPYTLPQDHTLLALDRFGPEIWIEKHQLLRDLRGLALLITHPDYLDTPAKLDVYREFLSYLSEQHDGWRALPQQVVSWWHKREASQISHELTTQASIVGPAADRGRCLPLSALFSDLHRERDLSPSREKQSQVASL